MPTTFAAEQHWLAPSYYQPESGRLIASIHSWLVRTGKYTVLIDACSGNHKPRPGMPRFDMLNTQYLDRLREAGVQPEEIDFVMCTHLHVDHVGWNTQARERQVGADLPQRQVRDVAHRPRSLGGGGEEARTPRPTRSTPTTIRCCRSSRRRRPSSCRASTRCAAASRSSPRPATRRARSGSTSNSRGKRAIFAGDALHNPVQVPLWKWNSRFCEDRDLARQTRNTLLGDCVGAGRAC